MRSPCIGPLLKDCNRRFNRFKKSRKENDWMLLPIVVSNFTRITLGLFNDMNGKDSILPFLLSCS